MFERGTLSFRFRVARLHELSFSYKETLEQGKKRANVLVVIGLSSESGEED